MVVHSLLIWQPSRHLSVYYNNQPKSPKHFIHGFEQIKLYTNLDGNGRHIPTRKKQRFSILGDAHA